MRRYSVLLLATVVAICLALRVLPGKLLRSAFNGSTVYAQDPCGGCGCSACGGGCDDCSCGDEPCPVE